MQISEWEFETGFQFEFDPTFSATSLNLELRVAYRDEKSVLASTVFVLSVTAPEKVSPCADLTVEKLNQARQNYLFSFGFNDDGSIRDSNEIMIDSALKVEIIGKTSAHGTECAP
jgi:hypothetical protein